MVKNTVFKILLLFTHSVLSDSLQTLGLNTPGFPVLRYLLGLLKLMSIESVMPSNHLILCCSFLLLPSVFPSIRVFSNKSAVCIRWPKCRSFSLNICPSNDYSWLISIRIGWFDLLAAQGTLESLIQLHSLKASVLQHSAFFMVQLSHQCMTTRKTILLTIHFAYTWQSVVSASQYAV